MTVFRIIQYLIPFHFSVAAFGWTPQRDIEPASNQSNSDQGKERSFFATGATPVLIVRDPLDASSKNVFEVTLSGLSTAPSPFLRWQTSEGGNAKKQKKILSVTSMGGGGFLLTADLSGHPLWTGEVRNLQLVLGYQGKPLEAKSSFGITYPHWDYVEKPMPKRARNHNGSLKLATYFSEGAVVQHSKNVKVWGSGPAGSVVSARWGDGDVVTAAADESGVWRVTMPALEPGGPYQLTVTCRDEEVVVSDIQAGVVWVCAGQSNMLYRMDTDPDDRKLAQESSLPLLRQFSARLEVADSPQLDNAGYATGPWYRADNAKQSLRFSSVSYHFGKGLYEHLGMPVGIITIAWGGTPASAFTRPDLMEDRSDFEYVWERWDKIQKARPNAQKQYDAALSTWKKNGRNGQRPKPPASLRKSWQPGGVYHAMVAPFFPVQIEGVVYYQAESNSTNPEPFADLLSALMQSWRQGWNNPKMPFYFVQLPRYETEQNWALTRQAQLVATQRNENAWLSVQIDQGERDDIHPKNKRVIGERLANQVAHIGYGKTELPIAPVYLEARPVDGGLACRFETYGSALMSRGGPLNHFEIAGADKAFVPAEAEVTGPNEVYVSSSAIKSPQFVRYAWANFPDDPNLVSAEGLPVSPFSSESWSDR